MGEDQRIEIWTRHHRLVHSITLAAPQWGIRWAMGLFALQSWPPLHTTIYAVTDWSPIGVWHDQHHPSCSPTTGIALYRWLACTVVVYSQELGPLVETFQLSTSAREVYVLGHHGTAVLIGIENYHDGSWVFYVLENGLHSPVSAAPGSSFLNILPKLWWGHSGWQVNTDSSAQHPDSAS